MILTERAEGVRLAGADLLPGADHRRQHRERQIRRQRRLFDDIDFNTIGGGDRPRFDFRDRAVNQANEQALLRPGPFDQHDHQGVDQAVKIDLFRQGADSGDQPLQIPDSRILRKRDGIQRRLAALAHQMRIAVFQLAHFRPGTPQFPGVHRPFDVGLGRKAHPVRRREARGKLAGQRVNRVKLPFTGQRHRGFIFFRRPGAVARQTQHFSLKQRRFIGEGFGIFRTPGGDFIEMPRELLPIVRSDFLRLQRYRQGQRAVQMKIQHMNMTGNKFSQRRGLQKTAAGLVIFPGKKVRFALIQPGPELHQENRLNRSAMLLHMQRGRNKMLARKRLVPRFSQEQHVIALHLQDHFHVAVAGFTHVA